MTQGRAPDHLYQITVRLEKATFSRILAAIRNPGNPGTPAQFALLLAIGLTGLAVVEFMWPLRPRMSDGSLTRLLRSWLGPSGPALLPFLGAVFLYFYALGSSWGRRSKC